MNAPPTVVRYRAHWLATAAGRRLCGGAIVVAAGRVVGVETRPEGPAVDLGDVVLAPGLVNAHCHLDLDDAPRLEGRPAALVDWLRRVTALRRGSSPDLKVLESRAQSAVRGGTAAVGDIAASPGAADAVRRAGLAGVSYFEVLGLRPQRYEPLWRQAEDAFAQAGDGLEVGVSPHAPYSTAREVYRRSSQSGARRKATHWFESPEEKEFLATGGGPLRDFLTELGALDADAGCFPVNEPWELLDGGREWLLVHANQLDDADLEELTARQRTGAVAGVVYCPRTCEFFGFANHRWRELVDRRIPVGLGTDSLASSPTLDVLNDARHLTARGADPSLVFDLLIRGGAACLGMPPIGVWTTGDRADGVAFPFNGGDPIDSLVACDSAVAWTLTAGTASADPS